MGVTNSEKPKPNFFQIATLIFVIGTFILALVSVIFLLTTNNNDQTTMLTYTEIKNSLINGEKLRVVMHYKYTNFYYNDTKVEPSPG